MTRIDDTIFAEDNAFLNFMDIIEGGKEKFVLATEVQNACFPAKLSVNNDGTFNMAFTVPENFSEKVSSEFFFTHHCVLTTKGMNILVQNKDIHQFEQQLVCKEGGHETHLTLVSFRTDMSNELWSNSKQVAFCSYSKEDYSAYRIGVNFDLTTLTDQNSSWRNAVKLEINKKIFILYFVITNNKRRYMILKSQRDVNHDFFLEVLECVRSAIGLLSGYYIADSVWYMSMQPHQKESLTFRYEKLGLSIYNQHPLLDSGLYKDCPENERKLSAIQFEKLVLLFYNSPEMRRSAQILIQAGNISGLSKGSLAAVALETIKSKIINDKEEKTSLISDKMIRSQFRYELLKVLKKFKDRFDKNLYKRLESKLGQIDQPSNAERLEAPFESLGIELTSDEMYCLSCRNSFLHGVTIKPQGEFYQLLSQTELANIISNRLIMLTTMLILKKCGYTGKVVDWGYTEIVKWRAVYAMKSIKGYGNAFRDIIKPNEV